MLICSAEREEQVRLRVAKIFAKAVNCEHPVDGNPCGECPTCKAIAAGTSNECDRDRCGI